MKNRMWGITCSTTEEEYLQRMDALKVLSAEAYRYLVGVAPKERWITVFFYEHTRCDTLLNNMCETFNAKIATDRERAIITMLEAIRTRLLQRIEYRGPWIKTYEYPIPPVIKEKLDDESRRASSWRPIWNGADAYQVTELVGQYVVNLRSKKCSCRLWQIRGIPCVHAITCIVKNNQLPTDYVSDYYSTKKMVKLYENVLFPINGIEN